MIRLKTLTENILKITSVGWRGLNQRRFHAFYEEDTLIRLFGYYHFVFNYFLKIFHFQAYSCVGIHVSRTFIVISLSTVFFAHITVSQRVCLEATPFSIHLLICLGFSFGISFRVFL